MTGAALVVQGDALHLPLPDGSVDLIVTSPPYLWKRKYAIEGAGEMGNEANWRLYLDGLSTVTDELLRVLKPKGSIFVNLGDTRVADREPKWLGIPPKSRLLLPERYRVGCQDRYLSRGVIVRQVQIWEKANGLPESTVDRTRDSHEDFVHLVKHPRYYSALDEVRESYAPYEPTRHAPRSINGAKQGAVGNGHDGVVGARPEPNPLGKLPGSVWTIPSEPLRLPEHLGVQHYAAFPSEWPRRLILGFSPPGICLDCGQGRIPVVERGPRMPAPRPGPAHAGPSSGRRLNIRGQELAAFRAENPDTILGYACSCTPYIDHPGTGDTELSAAHRGSRELGRSKAPAGNGMQRWGPWREYHLDGWRAPPTRPSVVLDPFSGTGTTVMVARALGRIGVGVDLSRPYCRAARWRARHDGAKAISRTNLERQGQLL